MTVGVKRRGTRAEDIPALSIVIVTYNSRTEFEMCLPSLYAQDVSSEIIVVDNGSTDDTVPWLRRCHPQVRLLALDKNAGYGAANNTGIGLTRGHTVLILNPDTVVHPGALAELLHLAQAHPKAFITPKLLRPDGMVNTCGNRMHYTGITTCAGMGEKAEAYSGVHYPFALSGAAIMARKEAWLDVGGFDDQFFLYLEDTDLSLRARLKRYEIICASDAWMMHRYELNMSAEKFYYLERNRLLMILKIYEWNTFHQILPALLLTELSTWMFATIKGPDYVAAHCLGYMWVWQQRKHWLRDRRSIQATRRRSDEQLLSGATIVLPFRQLVKWEWLAWALESIMNPLYRRLWPWGEYTENGPIDQRRYEECSAFAR